MIILCNEKDANKKKFRDVMKIVVSDFLSTEDFKGDEDNVLILKDLLPSGNLMYHYLNNSMSNKKFKKAYITEIIEDDEAYANLLLVMQGYASKQLLLLVSSEDEFSQYGFPIVLAEFIAKHFSANVAYYDEVSSLDKSSLFKHFSLDFKLLKKEIKAYGKVISFVDEEVCSKKKKKKDKKKDKQNKKETKKKDKSKKDKKKNKKVKTKFKGSSRSHSFGLSEDEIKPIVELTDRYYNNKKKKKSNNQHMSIAHQALIEEDKKIKTIRFFRV